MNLRNKPPVHWVRSLATISVAVLTTLVGIAPDSAHAFGVAPTISPTIAIELGLEELVSSSDRIVLGTVEGAIFEKIEGRMVTHTTISVSEELLKSTDDTLNPGQDDGQVVVTTLGGQDGDLVQWVSGEATFVEGDSVLVFLERRGDDSEHWFVVGMVQGKMSLATLSSLPDEIVAIQDTTGLSLKKVSDKDVKSTGIPGEIPRLEEVPSGAKSFRLDEIKKAVAQRAEPQENTPKGSE